MHVLLLLIAAASALVNDNKYQHYGKVDGTATDYNNAPFTRSLVQCGSRCQSDPSCNGYATMDREEGGYYCMKTSCPAQLPVGKWTTYKKKGMTEVCNEPKMKILQRKDGSVNFERVWADYKAGFGDPDGEHWLGLDNIHHLTTEHSYGLNVTMGTWDSKYFWAYYSTFTVGPESDNYRLSVSGYDFSSTAADSLSYHNNMAFSTLDRDNDISSTRHCSADRKGGWWYKSCRKCNPTGRYAVGGVDDWSGIAWYDVPGYSKIYSFKEMTFTLIRQ